MLYATECWPTKRRHVQQLSIAEMRMLQWLCSNTRRNRVRNDDICERLRVAPIEEKLMQHRFRWFGYIQWRPVEALVRSGIIRWTGNEKRGRGRPNLTWQQSLKRDLKDWCITKELTLDRRELNLSIHIQESWSSVPSLLLPFLSKLFSSPFYFLLSVLLPFLLFSIWFFVTLRFPLLFRPCFIPIFWLMWFHL
jgi:hypothetical protein